MSSGPAEKTSRGRWPALGDDPTACLDEDVSSGAVDGPAFSAGTFIVRGLFAKLMVMKGPKPPISTKRATSRTSAVSNYDPKFYAHAYAARLERQVTAELEPSRRTLRPIKKKVSKGRSR
jgi:hypothetical protein